MSEIFVFGSNLAGRHGAGAAFYARKYCGAIQGKGIGPQGQSYAIPTKDRALRPLSLDRIELFVLGFIAYARRNPGLQFRVTAIGTGLAGYSAAAIAPFFKNAPANCRLPEEWAAFIKDGDGK